MYPGPEEKAFYLSSPALLLLSEWFPSVTHCYSRNSVDRCVEKESTLLCQRSLKLSWTVCVKFHQYIAEILPLNKSALCCMTPALH